LGDLLIGLVASLESGLALTACIDDIALLKKADQDYGREVRFGLRNLLLTAAGLPVIPEFARKMQFRMGREHCIQG